MANEYTILISSNFYAALNIEKAKKILFEKFVVIAFSDIIESAAVFGGNGIYLNAVAILVSEIVPDDMQFFLKETETTLGRIRGPESGGLVAIDLDLVELNGDILRIKDAEQEYYKNCIKTINICI